MLFEALVVAGVVGAISFLNSDTSSERQEKNVETFNKTCGFLADAETRIMKQAERNYKRGKMSESDYEDLKSKYDNSRLQDYYGK